MYYNAIIAEQSKLIEFSIALRLSNPLLFFSVLSMVRTVPLRRDTIILSTWNLIDFIID